MRYAHGEVECWPRLAGHSDSDDNGKSLKYDMVPSWSEPAIKTDPSSILEYFGAQDNPHGS